MASTSCLDGMNIGRVDPTNVASTSCLDGTNIGRVAMSHILLSRSNIGRVASNVASIVSIVVEEKRHFHPPAARGQHGVYCWDE